MITVAAFLFGVLAFVMCMWVRNMYRVPKPTLKEDCPGCVFCKPADGSTIYRRGEPRNVQSPFSK